MFSFASVSLLQPSLRSVALEPHSSLGENKSGERGGNLTCMTYTKNRTPQQRESTLTNRVSKPSKQVGVTEKHTYFSYICFTYIWTSSGKTIWFWTTSDLGLKGDSDICDPGKMLNPSQYWFPHI